MTANATNTGFTAVRTLSNAAYVANFYCQDIAGNLNNTMNVSFTVNVPAAVVETPASGGGGGGGSSVPQLSFSLDKDSFEKTIILNRIAFETIQITNDKKTPQQFTLGIETIEDIIAIDETTFSILAGETKEVELKIVSPKETGIYAGKLIIKGEGKTKVVNIIINVKTDKSLFDITLTVPKSMKVMNPGNNFTAQIDLIQMGIREKIDVTLNYVIKDFDGNTYLQESETIAVLEQKSIQKEFYTENILVGDYVFGVELIYPDGVAVASSQFKVKNKVELLEKENMITIIIILAVAITIIFVITFAMARRYRNMLNKIKKNKT